MPLPEGYSSIQAHKESIDRARETKQELGVTWNGFLNRAADELEENTQD